jgi:hypothetical protein
VHRALRAVLPAAHGQFLHHHPEGGEPSGGGAAPGSLGDQLHRTSVAWSFVARPDEECVLWDLDVRVGVVHPWGTR